MKFPSILLGALAALALSLSARAAEVPFNQDQFKHALEAGKPVVVDFAADWCPTCRAQKPILSAIAQEPAMAGLTLFVANFDTEKELKKTLRVSAQSTLVVFKGGKEVTRSTGQTSMESLHAVLAQAL
jgi:thioredoxin 1